MPKSLDQQLRNPVAWRFTLACYWMLLFVLTHMPVNEALAPAAHHDKIGHFIAYAVLSLILATTWQLSAGDLSVSQLIWVWLAVIAFAMIDEWSQGFVNREPSIRDWIADAIGAAIGLVAFAGARRMLRRYRDSTAS